MEGIDDLYERTWAEERLLVAYYHRHVNKDQDGPLVAFRKGWYSHQAHGRHPKGRAMYEALQAVEHWLDVPPGPGADLLRLQAIATVRYTLAYVRGKGWLRVEAQPSDFAPALIEHLAQTIHATWRDVMLAQGREVPEAHLTWRGLDDRDREHD